MTCSEITKNAATTLKNWFSSFKRGTWSQSFVASLRGIDVLLLITVLLLLSFGLVMVYSASYIYSAERTGDGFAFIKKQLGFAAIGLGAMWFAIRTDYRNWMKWSYPILGFALGLLILVLIPGIGMKVGGAQRWLNLGIAGFQPGEIAKFAVICFVSRQLVMKRERLNRFVPGVLGNFLLPIPIFLLLLLQPDFGSTAIIALVILGLMFLAGVPARFVLGSIGTVAILGGALIFSSSYRMARFKTFLDPWQDPNGKGFQVIQSLLGLHNGHFWGVGLGNGKEKLFYLPEAHNDFIFAVVGEELGFIGIVAVVSAYLYLIYRGFRIAWTAYRDLGDLFGLLLASGLTLLLGLQGFINMFVAFGLLPTKGLTLPFVSYGGSALIFNLFAVGILLSIARASSSHGQAKYSV